jgi:hypothetical protein
MRPELQGSRSSLGFGLSSPSDGSLASKTRQNLHMRLADHRGRTADTVSESASALVTQMQAELHSLVTQHNGLTQRIRSIYRVMQALQELTTASAFDHVRVIPQPASADRAIARRSNRYGQSALRSKSGAVSISLQRACRIALMETETAVSMEEIYARIVRRGSFSFADTDLARVKLFRVLAVMAEDGEVRLLDNGPDWRWERKVPLEEE